MKAKLLRVPLGVSAKEYFAKEMATHGYGRSVLVLPNHMLMNKVRELGLGEVLSMDSLAVKILNANGYSSFKLLSQRSREIILKDLISNHVKRGDFTYFEPLAGKNGFVHSFLGFISQLSRSGVKIEEFSSALAAWDRTGKLGLKDRETDSLYTHYRNYLEENDWYDLEGIYRLGIWLLQNTVTTDCIWQHIYISDFYVLNKLQTEFIRELSKTCQVIIGMSYEKEREKIFAASQNTYDDLMTFCEAEDFTTETGSLNHYLADNWKRSGIKKGTSGNLPKVQISAFNSQDEEMRWVLKQVKKDLSVNHSDNGEVDLSVEPKDILLAVRSLASYSGLRSLADDYGIPVSLPAVSPLAVQPLTEIVLLLLKAVPDTKEGADAYFSLLTAPFVRLFSTADFEVVETERKDHFFSCRSVAQKYLHTQIEEENDIWRKFDKFIATVPAKGCVSVYVKQIKEFLDNLGLQKRLGDIHKMDKLDIWAIAGCLACREKLIQVLDLIAEDYENCRHSEISITLADFLDDFAEALKEKQIVLRQGREDGVQIAEAINIQGLDFKEVYILGLRQGEFPKNFPANWLYNEQERDDLRALGIDLPNIALNYAEDEYFYLTTALAARKKLVLTWYVEEGEKPKDQASPYIADMSHLYPEVKIELPSDNRPASVSEMEFWAAQNDIDWIKKNVGSLFFEASVVDKKRQMHQKDTYNGVLYDLSLRDAIAKRIGKSFSASALEKYAECPFRFLGERIWRQEEIIPRDEAMQPSEQGSILHETLARFTHKHLGEKLSGYDKKTLEQELKQVFEDVSIEYANKAGFSKNDLWQGEKPRLKRLLKRWLDFSYKDSNEWDYTPFAAELPFGSREGVGSLYLNIEIPNDMIVELEGRIDRLDSDGDKIFITDYKLSEAPTSSDLKNGLDLQLSIYLLASAKMFKNKQISGGCYFSLKEAKRQSKLILDKNIPHKELTYSEIENDETGICLNKTWVGFRNFTEYLLKNYIQDIYMGNFILNPRKCNKYCQLKDICRINEVQAKGRGEYNE